MNNDNKNTLEVLLSEHGVQEVLLIAQAAGHKILEIYDKDFSIEYKHDDSPLTEADLASHQYIVSKLALLTPGIPILSEESSNVSWEERKVWDSYWLIDPIDGTKEFIKRNGEFTVNIALIHKNKPVLGVVYAPAMDITYYASSEIGAWKEENSKTKRIQCAAALNADKVIKVVGSRSHQSDEMQVYLQKFSNYEIVAMGSSLKLCLVAEGAADIYPRLGLTSEWDTAAAHAVVLAAGGQCKNYSTGEELLYNTKESLLNPFFIVQGS